MSFDLFDPTPEIRANGEPSRIRSHKGNTPILPQTKCCPLCPAKFTRTTHLHRHLRSHTNERLYKCELCVAEFTRSDLLTRHQKTCGDPAMNRSRRKSCEACAESKVKCDLQYPCSKCINRGKACFFVNDPAISRHRKLQSGKKATARHQTQSHDTDSSPSPQSSPSASPITIPTYTASSPSSSGSFYDSGYSSLSSSSPPPPIYKDLGFLNGPITPPTSLAADSEWWAHIFGPGPFSSDDALNMEAAPHPSPAPSITMRPEVELDHYLFLFFETFSAQFPIIHRRTWDTCEKHPTLLRAMQACGALFVKTRRAFLFISETITQTREVIMEQFARASPHQRDLLTVAVALLQTIGLFHKNTRLRESSNIWHGMLIMMIRQSNAVKRSQSWSMPDLDDLQNMESAWQDWGVRETVKRGLLLSYLHDCCHCIFFSMSPALKHSEADLHLPCDPQLWDAPSAVEWYAAVTTDEKSLPGGTPMHQAYQALSTAHRSLAPMNKFGMFILAHRILRNMYSQGPDSDLPMDSDERMSGHLGFHWQFVLHNWLQVWSNMPGASVASQDVPFAYDALPFYWLAQVSLFAIQSGLNDRGKNESDSRFYVMKEWLTRIRCCLRTTNEVPPDLWKELMLIREQIAVTASSSSESCLDPPDGVASFFST